MGTDTRIAIVVVLFYLLNGVMSVSESGPFILPVFISHWLLGITALIYFTLSLRSWQCIWLLLFVFHFAVEIYFPPLPGQPATFIQYASMAALFSIPLALYIHTAFYFRSLTKNLKTGWILHMLFFMLSLSPVFFEKTAIVSLVAGIAQACTGIYLLSSLTDDKKLYWKKRVVLMMILIVFFDAAHYIFFMSIAHSS